MTLHTKIGLAKSVLRIIGFFLLLGDTVGWGVLLLILAEGLGIAEELWPDVYKGTATK